MLQEDAWISPDNLKLIGRKLYICKPRAEHGRAQQASKTLFLVFAGWDTTSPGGISMTTRYTPFTNLVFQMQAISSGMA